MELRSLNLQQHLETLSPNLKILLDAASELSLVLSSPTDLGAEQKEGSVAAQQLAAIAQAATDTENEKSVSEDVDAYAHAL